MGLVRSKWTLAIVRCPTAHLPIKPVGMASASFLAASFPPRLGLPQHATRRICEASRVDQIGAGIDTTSILGGRQVWLSDGMF